MSQELEFEAKNLLTKKEYELLCKHLNHTNTEAKIQINYYFETEDFALKNKGAALRIREKDDRYILTLKQPHGEGLLETHEPLSSETMQKWISNQPTLVSKIGKQLQALNVSPGELIYGGNLVTKRIELNQLDALIVLDKSEYNNIVDYELEVEADNIDLAEHVIEHLLNTYHIPKRKTQNKTARFYLSLS